MDKTTKEEMREKIANLLADDYACTRVWEAWQYGTMSRDDFILLSDTERVDELLALIESAVRAARINEQHHTKLCMHMSEQKCHITYCKDGQKIGEGISQVERIASLEAELQAPPTN